ncbi:MAG TPA: dihydrofolate reductase family protein [Chloroflexota bacterium]|nr:dihydrofolate reductase family protein [Chloroflexota bacterium]
MGAAPCGRQIASRRSRAPEPAPLETLFEQRLAREVALPSRLAELYGSLFLPARSGWPHVIGNFVSSLDGVVALSLSDQTGGGEISGFNAEDQMIMGLLRAIADVVIVGAGTLRSAPRHLWTAEAICRPLAGPYAELRASLGKPLAPLNVVVSASGALDLTLPVFASGKVPALIVTSPAGERRLRESDLPPSVRLAVGGEVGGSAPDANASRRVPPVAPSEQQPASLAPLDPGSAGEAADSGHFEPGRRAEAEAATASQGVYGGEAGLISAGAVLEAVLASQPAEVVLTEGGPRLMSEFLAEGLLDELFLTLAPQVAGREPGAERPGFVAGRHFLPDDPRWGSLVSLKRAGSYLFLRYAFGRR